MFLKDVVAALILVAKANIKLLEASKSYPREVIWQQLAAKRTPIMAGSD